MGFRFKSKSSFLNFKWLGHEHRRIMKERLFRRICGRFYGRNEWLVRHKNICHNYNNFIQFTACCYGKIFSLHFFFIFGANIPPTNARTAKINGSVQAVNATLRWSMVKTCGPISSKICLSLSLPRIHSIVFWWSTIPLEIIFNAMLLQAS